MKVFARFLLLSLWLFAMAAPSVITLLDTDNPIIVTNINEEEHQEPGKKSSIEEKFVNHHLFEFALIPFAKHSSIIHHYMLGDIDFTLEILLPPPERLS